MSIFFYPVGIGFLKDKYFGLLKMAILEQQKTVFIGGFFALALVLSMFAAFVFLMQPSHEKLTITLNDAVVDGDFLNVSINVRNPSSKTKNVALNVTSPDFPFSFFSHIDVFLEKEEKTFIIAHELPEISVLPSTAEFFLNVSVDNKDFFVISQNITLKTPTLPASGWKIVDGKNYVRKGEPWKKYLWINLSKFDVMNAEIITKMQVDVPVAFNKAFKWPTKLVGFNPFQRNLTVPRFETAEFVIIQLKIGPFIYDSMSQSYYAFNINKTTRNAKYTLDWFSFNITKGSNVLLSYNITTSQELGVELLPNQHAVLAVTFVDALFLSDYGDVNIFLDSLEKQTFVYENLSYQVGDFFNVTYVALPLNWSIPENFSAEMALDLLPTLAKQQLNLSIEWNYDYTGTYWAHHGFDLLAGLSGRQNIGEQIGGYAYISGNMLSIFGGWYENSLLQRKYSYDTMKLVFLHEFFHTLGAEHTKEQFGFIMAPQLGNWVLHPDTYKIIKDKFEQYDGMSN